jgi:archaeosine synthase
MVTEELAAYVEANPYDAIVAHLGAEAPIVHAALPDTILSTKDHPSSDDSLAALTRTLNQVAGSAKSVGKGQRFAEEMTNIAGFQFGDAGRRLVEGATFRGRFPAVRIIRDGQQVAMHTERGLLSLTLEGGEILSEADSYWVEIEDFLPKGNVFAVGVVEASHEVRPGDEVVVRHNGDVRAVGTARLGWREMKDLERGEAVHVRHVKGPPP